jgi:serine/threonine protein phosphatase PrpC
MKFRLFWWMTEGPRAGQEDCIVVPGALYQENRCRHSHQGEGAGLDLAVFDGMGGHIAGGLASRFFGEQFQMTMPTTDGSAAAVADVLAGIQLNSLTQLPARSGTTLAGISCRANLATIFNAGDSRAYQINANGLVRLSHDHSFVQQLVDQGLITEENAFSHPHRNVINFGLGPIFSDIWDMQSIYFHLMEIRDPVHYLFCTDGVSDVLQDAEIHAALGMDPLDRGDDLIEALTGKGLKDNTSFIVLEVCP